MVEEVEPRQLKELGRWLVDLTEEKKRERKMRAKV
jgi:hypothetical protein